MHVASKYANGWNQPWERCAESLWSPRCRRPQLDTTTPAMQQHRTLPLSGCTSAPGHLRTVNRRLDQSHERPVPNYEETLTVSSRLFSRRDKKELVHHRRYETRVQAVHEITAYIESFCSRQRLHSRLGYFSAAVFAKRYYTHRTAA